MFSPKMDENTSIDDQRIAMAQLLHNEFVQHKTLDDFALSCASIWDSWTIERTISTTDGVIQWLAYARLVHLFAFLKEIIARERRSGMFQRKRGVGADSIAINIYQDALEGQVQRRKIVERRRIGKRW
ncbi:uncharacterized protein B0T15DRAFT_531220 [Chaetomium strumarium]|uniref:Uncharacterized protein n=1 Tax=Chaetomium strumarium TaxID=1170767 RepID=A0AAJ0GS20_9PEZI|nr:hypothetical protein B0T15DRAFT_531220 [Chaetomium strumarium]